MALVNTCLNLINVNLILGVRKPAPVFMKSLNLAVLLTSEMLTLLNSLILQLISLIALWLLINDLLMVIPLLVYINWVVLLSSINANLVKN